MKITDKRLRIRTSNERLPGDVCDINGALFLRISNPGDDRFCWVRLDDYSLVMLISPDDDDLSPTILPSELVIG